MPRLLTATSILLAMSSAAAAEPEDPRRLSLLAGASMGGAEHAGNGRERTGLHIGAELQIGRLYGGATLGEAQYGGANSDLRLHASELAAHAGASFQLDRWTSAGVVRELQLRAALELGRHHFSPDRTVFSGGLGNNETLEGEERVVWFTGVRTGLSLSAVSLAGGGLDLVANLDVIGRRDIDRVAIAYEETFCSYHACDITPGRTRVGGHETMVVASIGILLGR